MGMMLTHEGISEIMKVLRKFSPISPSTLKSLGVIVHLHSLLNLTTVIEKEYASAPSASF